MAILSIVSVVLGLVLPIGAIAPSMAVVYELAVGILSIGANNWDVYMDNAFWADIKQAFFCNCPSDGIFTESSITRIHTNISRFEGESNPFYHIANLLVGIAGARGLNNCSRVYHSEGGDCGGFNCQETLEYDFTEGTQGWSVWSCSGHPTGGDWVSDTGWSATLDEEFSGLGYSLTIWKAMPQDFHATGARVIGHTGGREERETQGIQWNDGCNTHVTFGDTLPVQSPIDEEYEFTSEVMGTVGLLILDGEYRVNAHEPSLVTKIYIYGYYD